MLRINSRPNTREKSGFTLIELLVAISVLAVVAVLGWSGLDSITRARVALTEEMERTRGLQLAFAQMERDYAHMVSPAILPDRAALAVEPERIVLVRRVFAENQPARLQVVAYSVKDGFLVRRESDATRDLNVLDSIWASAIGDEGKSQDVVLQPGVASMMARAWVSDGQGWRSDIAAATERVMIRDAAGNWHPAAKSDAAVNAIGPSGLEVVLQLQGRATAFTKIFLLGPV